MVSKNFLFGVVLLLVGVFVVAILISRVFTPIGLPLGAPVEPGTAAEEKEEQRSAMRAEIKAAAKEAGLDYPVPEKPAAALDIFVKGFRDSTFKQSGGKVYVNIEVTDNETVTLRRPRPLPDKKHPYFEFFNQDPPINPYDPEVRRRTGKWKDYDFVIETVKKGFEKIKGGTQTSKVSYVDESGQTGKAIGTYEGAYQFTDAGLDALIKWKKLALKQVGGGGAKGKGPIKE